MKIKEAVGQLLIQLIDRSVLWLHGWERIRIVPGMEHFADPITGNFHTRNRAIEICEKRARKKPTVTIEKPQLPARFRQ